MTDYYLNCFNKGLEYQDFIMEKLLENLGIPISNFSSKKYQFSKGENLQGIEIKYDDKYKKTGNIYIEVAEKSNPNNKEYIPSGIMRNDNSWLYAIGDYSILFIFGKQILKLQYNKNLFKTVVTGTSKGMLLDKKGQNTALKILKF